MKNGLLLLITIFCSLSAFAQGPTPPPNGTDFGQDTVVHYWHFNNLTTFPADTSLHPDVTLAPGSLVQYRPLATQTAVAWDTVGAGTSIGATSGTASGLALRLRNPAGVLILSIPTTGFDSVRLSYAVSRTNKGAQQNNVSYSLDGGLTYNSAGLSSAVTSIPTASVYQLVSHNFSGIAGVKNNPNFKVKIQFAIGDTNATGNDRFDNILVRGRYFNVAGLPSASMASQLSLSPNPVSSGGMLHFGRPLTGTVYNAAGIVIASVSQSESFNTESLHQGLYLLRTAQGACAKFLVQ